MKETYLYHDLIDAIKQRCDYFNLKHHIVRIESNMTIQGIPDIYCCVDGRSFWVECKVGSYELSPLQISWRTQEYMAGGHVFHLCQVKNIFQLELNDTWIFGFDSLVDVVGRIFSRMGIM